MKQLRRIFALLLCLVLLGSVTGALAMVSDSLWNDLLYEDSYTSSGGSSGYVDDYLWGDLVNGGAGDGEGLANLLLYGADYWFLYSLFIISAVFPLLDRIKAVHYNDIYLSASIGVSIFPDDAQTLEDMYAMADKAMYAAKKTRDNYVFAEDIS